MNRPFFIGDRVTALGYQLAGVRVQIPEDDELEETFRSAVAETDFVLITQEYADRLPVSALTDALRAEQPLVVVVPDVLGRVPPTDLSDRIRRVLGVE